MPVYIIVSATMKPYFDFAIKEVQSLITTVFNNYVRWCRDNSFEPELKRLYLRPFIHPQTKQTIKNGYRLELATIINSLQLGEALQINKPVPNDNCPYYG